MQLEWEKTVAVGEGKVRFNVQLLTQNAYLRLEDLMSEQIVTGNVRTLGMKLGRIKELLITNGIAWEKVAKGKQRKVLYVTHPELKNGREFDFEIQNFDSPLNDPEGKIATPEDGEWMAGLSDGLAGAIAEMNPGLSSDKYAGLIDLFVKSNDEEDEELSEDEKGNPTGSGTDPDSSEEDTSTSGVAPTSSPLLAQ